MLARLKKFSPTLVSLCVSCVRDHFRLGKFNKKASHARPILLKLNRTADVSLILSLRNTLPRPINVKEDLSYEERKTAAILLKERWNFIQSGVDRKNVKIRGSSLFLNKKFLGQCKDGKFCPASPAPSIVLPSASNSTERDADLDIDLSAQQELNTSVDASSKHDKVSPLSSSLPSPASAS